MHRTSHQRRATCSSWGPPRVGFHSRGPERPHLPTHPLVPATAWRLSFDTFRSMRFHYEPDFLRALDGFMFFPQSGHLRLILIGEGHLSRIGESLAGHLEHFVLFFFEVMLDEFLQLLRVHEPRG